MHKVTGIGGAFFRAKDPTALSQWYEKHLGINAMGTSTEMWIQKEGPTVFAPFPSNTEYFGNQGQSFMFNFRVDNLEEILEQLRDSNVKIVKEMEDHKEIGKFGWIEDPEGNRIELWEPSTAQ